MLTYKHSYAIQYPCFYLQYTPWDITCQRWQVLASSLPHALHHSSMLSRIWTCIPNIPNVVFFAIPNKLCLVMSSVIEA